MSRTPASPNQQAQQTKSPLSTSKIQHSFKKAFEILTKDTQQYMNYYKYLCEYLKQIKKINEVLSGLTCGKNAHPELQEAAKTFDTLRESNNNIKNYLKSDEVKNCDKRESRENDFITKKKGELKKTLTQITNLHTQVIRIIKKPPDSSSCFNALEDGFKYHCDYLMYCSELTNLQNKLLKNLDEIQKEVIGLGNDFCQLQSRCDSNAYEQYLIRNPKYTNDQQQDQLSPEKVDEISKKYSVLSERVIKGVALFREPQFLPMDLFHFMPPFKPLEVEEPKLRPINISFPSTPILTEPEKLLSGSGWSPVQSVATPILKFTSQNITPVKSNVQSVTRPIIKSPIQSGSSDYRGSSASDPDDKSAAATETDGEASSLKGLQDFLDSSDSGSNDDAFGISTFPSVAPTDMSFDNQDLSPSTSPMNSNSVCSKMNECASAANYHQKIANVLAVRPRSSMKFVAVKQYKSEDYGKELSVEVRDVVEVLDANMTDYWYCKKGNTEGFLPSIILEPCAEMGRRVKSAAPKEFPNLV